MSALDALTPDDREAKLPAWARKSLDELRRRTRDAEALAERARLDTDPDGSGAILDRMDRKPVGLGEDPDVSFRVRFPGVDPSLSLISVRRSDSGRGLYLVAAGEVVCRQQAINAVEVVPWPKHSTGDACTNTWHLSDPSRNSQGCPSRPYECRCGERRATPNMLREHMLRCSS